MWRTLASYDYHPSVEDLTCPSVRTVEGLGQPCEYVFAKDQPWPRTTRLSFIDETLDLANIYDHDLILTEYNENERAPVPSSSSTRHASTPRVMDRGSDSGTPTTLCTPRDELPSPMKRRRFDHELSSGADVRIHDHTPALEYPEEVITPSSRHSILQSPYVQRFESEALEIDFSSTNSALEDLQVDMIESVAEVPQIYIDNPQWPLRDLEQAKLMRYYIDNIAPFFDLCDLKRHFALVVPHRAASCPPLLNAVFAASARHLSRTAGAEAWIADNYHSECLKSLIPLLNDSAALTDENLLAAMIILRYHEEIECKREDELDMHVSVADQNSSTFWNWCSESSSWHSYFHGRARKISSVRRTPSSSILGWSAHGALRCVLEFKIHTSKS